MCLFASAVVPAVPLLLLLRVAAAAASSPPHYRATAFAPVAPPPAASRRTSCYWERCAVQPGKDGAATTLSSSPSSFLFRKLDGITKTKNTSGGGDTRRPPKILVLGGTGFLGSEIVRLLSEREIPCVATSTDGRDGTVALDVTSADAEATIERLVREGSCTAVISAVGSLGDAARDRVVNAADGAAAAAAARTAGCDRFVCVGASSDVAERAGSLGYLAEYLAGKAEAEERVREAFGPDDDADSRRSRTVLKPTFIYGGDEVSFDPPRLPSGIGAVADELLGLYPLQALADALPGPLGLALRPPLSVESVARAAVNAAVGLCDDRSVLETKDDIVMVGARRKEADLRGVGADAQRRRREELKGDIVKSTTEFVPEEEVISDMDELETLRPPSSRPVYDPRLNGRWNFVFTVEPDLGTGLIKQLLEGQSPLQFFFDLRGVCMEIKDEQSTINIKVDTRVLGQEVILIITTCLEPDDTNPDGTMFYERFEGLNLFGIDLPIPKSWKRSRYLEIPFLDDDLMMARGAGREPHFLLRME